MDLREAKTVDDVSSYVQENARYYADAPKKPYTVRHPHKYAGQSVFSADTHDLVTQLCKIYKIKD
jgi:hypothetical protein